MSDQLELTLSQLLVPDNEVIQQATAKIKEALNDPGIVPALCGILSTSTNPQVRQYAAVLLRRKVLKKKQWTVLSDDLCNNIRQNILQVLLREPEKSVQKAVAQIVATVGKHDLPDNKWPELFQFLQTYTSSDQVEQRQVGMFVLQTLASSAAEQLQPHFSSLLQLCSKTLNDNTNVLVPFYTIMTLTELVPLLGTDELRPMQSLIPRLVDVIRALIPVDEGQATEALEIFDELVESEVAVIVPHIKLVMEFCLQIGANAEYDDALRVKALSFISWITRLKRKSIMKLKLVQPILHVLMPILCTAPEDEDEDIDEVESHTPHSFAAQVIDVMSINLPPEKFIPMLCHQLDPLLASEDANHRRAAYICMAVAAEGSADHIRNKLLKPWLQSVYKGLNDPHPIVRNAALFALGQFSEHLQPEISKFSEELLPILFNYLGQATEHIDKDPKGVVKTYYALEMFVENLGDDLLPYLPQLMNYLLASLTSSSSLKVKTLALSAIAATANSAQKQIVPYFQQIIDQITPFLQNTDDEARLKLQTQAIETLACLARTVGSETFLPLSAECTQLGLKLLETGTDPDLRRCIYGMFAAVSTIVKEEMGPHLAAIVPPMIEAMKSTEGVTTHYSDEVTDMFKMFDDVEETIDEDGEEEEDQDIQGFSVGNSYLDEKEDACTSLGELAINTGSQFLPFLPDCYAASVELLEYPAPDIRKGAVTAISNFCCAMATVAEQNNNNAEIHGTLSRMLEASLDKLLVMIKDDKDRQVVMVILEALAEMATKAKETMFAKEGRLDEVMAMVKLVVLEKTACQDESEEAEFAGAEADEDDTAEHDAMLIEAAGDVLPAVAKVVGGAKFVPYFAGFLPDLLKRLKVSKSVAEKSFAIGTMAENLMACGPASKPFSSHLYPVFLANTKDDDGEVRSNAVFGLGIVMSNGLETMYGNYPAALKALSELARHESNKRVVDNVCAAVCRLINTHSAGVPMTEVLPMIVQCLPLKEDHEENVTVFKCLAELYAAGQQDMIKLLPPLLLAIGHVLGTEQITPETQTLLVQLVQDVSQKHVDIFQHVLSSNPTEIVEKLHACVAQVNGS